MIHAWNLIFIAFVLAGKTVLDPKTASWALKCGNGDKSIVCDDCSDGSAEKCTGDDCKWVEGADKPCQAKNPENSEEKQMKKMGKWIEQELKKIDDASVDGGKDGWLTKKEAKAGLQKRTEFFLYVFGYPRGPNGEKQIQIEGLGDLYSVMAANSEKCIEEDGFKSCQPCTQDGVSPDASCYEDNCYEFKKCIMDGADVKSEAAKATIAAQKLAEEKAQKVKEEAVKKAKAEGKSDEEAQKAGNAAAKKNRDDALKVAAAAVDEVKSAQASSSRSFGIHSVFGIPVTHVLLAVATLAFLMM